MDLTLPTARGTEHEITTLKRLDKKELRCGAAKGRSTLIKTEDLVLIGNRAATDGALMGLFDRGGKWAYLMDFDRLLSMVPASKPEPGDELPSKSKLGTKRGCCGHSRRGGTRPPTRMLSRWGAARVSSLALHPHGERVSPLLDFVLCPLVGPACAAAGVVVVARLRGGACFFMPGLCACRGQAAGHPREHRSS